MYSHIFVIVLECEDNFPEAIVSEWPGYDCAVMANQGRCKVTWASFFGAHTGDTFWNKQIKEDCRKSCGECSGKYTFGVYYD